MPKYKTEVAHDLGQKEAIERIKQNTDWARSVSDLQGSWNDNEFAFSVSIQGVKLNGTIQVEADSLKLDAQLPLLAMPFRGWAANILRNALKVRAAKDYKPTANSTNPIVLFLHIPKAGGTTLGDYIFNQCRAEEDYDEGLLKSGVLFLAHGFVKEDDSSLPESVQKILRRTDLRAVIGHFEFGVHEHLNRPWTYVTLLRDPVERVISLYYYLKLEDKMSIEQFALVPPLKEVDNDQTRRLAGVNPGIGACTNEDLRTAQENLRQHFAVVGVTERFDETLVLLKRKLNWTKEVFSYPKNVNPKKNAVNSLSPNTIEAIRKRNELDFELYRYAIQLMEEAIAAEGSGFYEQLRQYQALYRDVDNSSTVSTPKTERHV